jgi:hypothetical protein
LNILYVFVDDSDLKIVVENPVLGEEQTPEG